MVLSKAVNGEQWLRIASRHAIDFIAISGRFETKKRTFQKALITQSICTDKPYNQSGVHLQYFVNTEKLNRIIWQAGALALHWHS